MRTTEIERAARALRNGELVGIPTETVYGLSALASDESAVRNVFHAKGRPFFDPLIVHGADLEQLSGVVQGMSPVERFLADRFWPGPLTIVTEKVDGVSELITSGLTTVAVRVPNHPLTLELLRRLREPVVAPSANLFGRTSPTAVSHVESDFPDLLVLDGGDTAIGIESTVIRCADSEVAILRPGGIGRSELEEALKDGRYPHQVVRQSSVQSPGHLKHHYQPRKLLRVVRGELDPENFSNSYVLELPNSSVLAARSLYSLFREGDRSPEGEILLRWTHPIEGEWEAIWDRVSRAATEIIE